MAESTSIVFENATITNQLDENENPALLDLNLSDANVCSNSTKPLTGVESINFNVNPDNSMSHKAECLESKKFMPENESQSGNSEDGCKIIINNDSSFLTYNSILANEGLDSVNISCLAPDPNFMNNSLSSNEGNLSMSKCSNHNAVSNISEISDNGKENSVECEEYNKINLSSSLNKDVNFSPSNPVVLLNTSNNTVNCVKSDVLVNCEESDALKNHPIESDAKNSGDLFELPESATLIDINSEEVAKISQDMPKSEDNMESEEFQDAVQFFKDPSSFQFLENIKTSDQSALPRDSLYMTFDPLHKKFIQPVVENNVPSPTGKNVGSDTVNVHVSSEKESVAKHIENNLAVDNKTLTNIVARESFGNILLSFDSPMKSNSARSSSKTGDCQFSDVPKLYTEEELQQALKINELTNQEIYLKKQREMEEESKKNVQIKDEEIGKLSKVCFSLQNILEEFMSVTLLLKEKNEFLSTKNLELETEKQKLNDDLKTTTEDFQSVEHTFADFHKRYEQCKSMLKTYKENEDSLKLQIESLQKKLEEQEQMYNMLQGRTEEMVEKANAEVANIKKGGEAQIAVLKAQLKKSELKVSSLESDLKQARIENDKLSGICDDLMAKVSES